MVVEKTSLIQVGLLREDFETWQFWQFWSGSGEEALFILKVFRVFSPCDFSWNLSGDLEVGTCMQINKYSYCKFPTLYL